VIYQIFWGGEIPGFARSQLFNEPAFIDQIIVFCDQFSIIHYPVGYSSLHIVLPDERFVYIAYAGMA